MKNIRNMRLRKKVNENVIKKRRTSMKHMASGHMYLWMLALKVHNKWNILLTSTNYENLSNFLHFSVIFAIFCDCNRCRYAIFLYWLFDWHFVYYNRNNSDARSLQSYLVCDAGIIKGWRDLRRLWREYWRISIRMLLERITWCEIGQAG